MENLRSTRFSGLAPARERGFVLISVLVLAILYFALMQLLLVESSEAFRGASRLRSRVVAQTLAESGAELAARGMVGSSANSKAEQTTDGGSMKGNLTWLGGGRFRIVGEGTSTGAFRAAARVKIEGHVSGSNIVIERTIHH